jgi:hypothetical protein
LATFRFVTMKRLSGPDFDACEIPHRALEFGVTEKQLDHPDVSCPPTHEGRLDPPHGMRAIRCKIKAERLSDVARHSLFFLPFAASSSPYPTKVLRELLVGTCSPGDFKVWLCSNVLAAMTAYKSCGL